MTAPAEEVMPVVFPAEVPEVPVQEPSQRPDLVLLQGGAAKVEQASTPAIAAQRRAANPKFSIRPAMREDIPTIVDVDMATFDKVYSGDAYSDPEQLRQELINKFAGRMALLGEGSKWITVLERQDGKGPKRIVGAIMSCPTDKRPEDFISWEDTTDNGTLQGTYNPNGKYGYVVSLGALPEGSEGKNMLMVNHMSMLFTGGFEAGFFESRMPGFRDTVVANKLGGDSSRLAGLSEEQVQAFAEEYFGSTIIRNGREYSVDHLLRLYQRAGCKLVKLAADAYQDEESLNYGVACVYDGEAIFDGSDLPFKLPNNRFTRRIIGWAMEKASHSQKISNKLFG